MTKTYSMDDVLVHLHNEGEYPNTLNGVTVRSTTEQALRRRGWIDDQYNLTDHGQRRAERLDGQAVSENLDRPRSKRRLRLHWARNDWQVTFDGGEADYLWWDRARRGQVEGLGIAGAFLKPVASKKAAWVIGQRPAIRFSESEEAESAVNDWFEKNHADVVLAMEESVSLADSYIVVNPDMTVSVVAPNVVYPIVDENDYSKQVGWEIRQVYEHPEYVTMRQTIIDRFTPEKRVRIIKKGGKEVISREEYDNPLGIMPIVHIPNNLRAGERNGHPELEAILNVLSNYNEVMTSSTEGVLKMGKPIGVFEKFPSPDALDKFISEYGTATTMTDRTGDEYEVVDIQLDDVMALTGGEFNWKSPGSFSDDTVAILELLFYLIVQHTEMPEFIFGNAIASSRASAEAQLPPFVKWVEKEQGRAAKWVKQLIRIVVAMVAVYEVGVDEDADFKISWPALTDADGQLTLDAVKFAYMNGLITREVALQQLGRFMDIDDPAAVLSQLDDEQEERRARDEEPFVPDATPDDVAAPAEEMRESLLAEIPDKYSDIDFTPSQGMYDEAQRGLSWRDEYRRGGTDVGVATATAIIRAYENSTNILPEKWRHIARYFPRHEVDKEADGWNPGEDGYPSAGRVAWALWGGNPGKSRSNKIVAQMDTRDRAAELNAFKFFREEHTDAMVAFEIDLDTATNLALWTQQAGVNSVPPEDMHITLAYLGDVTDIDVDSETVLAALTAFTSEHPAISGNVGGIGRFNAGENTGGQDVLYASFDSPELAALRQALVDTLIDVGVDVNRAHGFTPHITLAYIDPNDVTPPLRLPTIPMTFEAVHLYWGGERTELSLTNETDTALSKKETVSV